MLFAEHRVCPRATRLWTTPVERDFEHRRRPTNHKECRQATASALSLSLFAQRQSNDEEKLVHASLGTHLTHTGDTNSSLVSHGSVTSFLIHCFPERTIG
jgi:hypothetical protein